MTQAKVTAIVIFGALAVVGAGGVLIFWPAKEAIERSGLERVAILEASQGGAVWTAPECDHLVDLEAGMVEGQRWTGDACIPAGNKMSLSYLPCDLPDGRQGTVGVYFDQGGERHEAGGCATQEGR